jgi:hypothetical protein
VTAKAGIFKIYFGQPSAGFFFASDFLIASFQSPSSFKRSSLGPGLAGFFVGRGLLFFILRVSSDSIAQCKQTSETNITIVSGRESQ